MTIYLKLLILLTWSKSGKVGHQLIVIIKLFGDSKEKGLMSETCFILNKIRMLQAEQLENIQ